MWWFPERSHSSINKNRHFLAQDKVTTFVWYSAIVTEKLGNFNKWRLFLAALFDCSPKRLVWIHHWSSAITGKGNPSEDWNYITLTALTSFKIYFVFVHACFICAAPMSAIRWGTRGRVPTSFSDSGIIICHVPHLFLFTFRNILVSHQAAPLQISLMAAPC